MTNMICDECETVAHCMKNGCVPAQQQEPAPKVVDCHATGVCVQSGLRAGQPAQDIQRLSALVRAQQITIDKLEAQRQEEKNSD